MCISLPRYVCDIASGTFKSFKVSLLPNGKFARWQKVYRILWHGTKVGPGHASLSAYGYCYLDSGVCTEGICKSSKH